MHRYFTSAKESIKLITMFYLQITTGYHTSKSKSFAQINLYEKLQSLWLGMEFEFVHSQANSKHITLVCLNLYSFFLTLILTLNLTLEDLVC